MQMRVSLSLIIGLALCSGARAQHQDEPSSTPSGKQKGAAREVASGAGTIGVGAAKGAGSAAKAVGKGAVDLATLHPIGAGTALGKGAGSAGKDVAVGTVKGTAKISKGVGKAVKKIL